LRDRGPGTRRVGLSLRPSRREEWNGEQLQSLHATTDDNGSVSPVAAERRRRHLVVERTAPAKVDGGAVRQGYPGPMSAASRCRPPHADQQWNLRQVQQTALLNTQHRHGRAGTGDAGGRDTVQTASGSVSATRYRYTGDLRMDQWFDDRGRWVKGTFTAFDGSTIEYILQE
jgi:hypothetical protein